MRRNVLALHALLIPLALASCATGRFQQVSFAGEASPVVEEAAAERLVFVVRNTEMKDVALLLDVREKDISLK